MEGQIIGTSDWLTITQEMINEFADVTSDNQWIHVDTIRAQQESPYKTTIAHGYLILSFVPYLLSQIYEIEGLKQSVNCGIKSFLFTNAVRVNSKVRLTATFTKVQKIESLCKTEIRCIMEIKDELMPAFEGTIIVLYYFDN